MLTTHERTPQEQNPCFLEILVWAFLPSATAAYHDRVRRGSWLLPDHDLKRVMRKGALAVRALKRLEETRWAY